MARGPVLNWQKQSGYFYCYYYFLIYTQLYSPETGSKIVNELI